MARQKTRSATKDVAGLEELDLRHLVHPLTKLAGLEDVGVTIFVEGRGLRLRDAAGREYLDAMSGLWNVNVGYGRAELGRAAASAATLGFASLYFGQSNEAAVRLARKLSELTPAGIERFFFSLGGSDANDTAIKVVRAYFALAGAPEKANIIGRRGSYHGSSLGAMSATGDETFWRYFGPRVPGFSHIDQPAGDGLESAAKLEAEIERLGADTVAAFIAEPISVPPGLAVPPDDYWPAIREICDRHGVLLIADEVITGFGRTGKMFALEHWQVEPDVMVMSKGITSGYMPLGAVGMIEEIYAGLTQAEDIFRHGFTAGGHPACCAVALANLSIIEREGLVEKARATGRYLNESLQKLARRNDKVARARGVGMIAAIDLQGVSGPDAGARLREEGLLLRPFGQTLVMAPSLVAEQTDVDEIVGRIEAALAEL